LNFFVQEKPPRGRKEPELMAVEYMAVRTIFRITMILTPFQSALFTYYYNHDDCAVNGRGIFKKEK